jgi:hypothetical protein
MGMMAQNYIYAVVRVASVAVGASAGIIARRVLAEGVKAAGPGILALVNV